MTSDIAVLEDNKIQWLDVQYDPVKTYLSYAYIRNSKSILVSEDN